MKTPLITFVFLIVGLMSHAQKPAWIKKTPVPTNDSCNYYYYTASKINGKDINEARKNADQFINKIILDSKGNIIDVIDINGEPFYKTREGQKLAWPKREVCSWQSAEKEWYFLYQIARTTLQSHYFEAFNCEQMDYSDQRQIDRTALACSLFPGLGQIIVKKNKPVGYAFMIGDLALIGGGVFCLLESNNQYDISQNPNYTSNYRQDAYDNYKMLDTSSKILFGAAAAVYVINLYTAYKMPKKTNGFALTPKLIPENNDLAFGIGISYNF